MAATNAIKVKLLEAMINNAISYRDINTWQSFLPDLYILPDERILHSYITDIVLAKVTTSSDVFGAWFILQGVESTFSKEVQSMYVSDMIQKKHLTKSGNRATITSTKNL